MILMGKCYIQKKPHGGIEFSRNYNVYCLFRNELRKKTTF